MQCLEELELEPEPWLLLELAADEVEELASEFEADMS